MYKLKIEIMNKIIFLGLIVIAMVSCSKSDDELEETKTNNGGGSEEVSEALIAAENYYDNTLKVIISNNCVSCHSGYHAGGNSNDYGIFSNANAKASDLYNAVNTGYMPRGAVKLSQDDIDRFKEFMELVEEIN